MSKVAFVSGATGYIAQHLIKILKSEGYKIVGSVRTTEKGENLKKLFGSTFEYEVVPDLKIGAFDEALKKHPDITVFFHTASPVFFPQDNFQETIIDPAVEGTKSALLGAIKYGKNIKKFVLTSSVAANGVSSQPPIVLSEDTWTDITPERAVSNAFDAYIGSKTFGEKAAWDIIKEQKPHFNFATVLPAYVFGPQAFDSEVGPELNVSVEFINKIIKSGPNDPVGDLEAIWIDVRDVAKAHFLAGTRDDIDNVRLVLQDSVFSLQEITDIINANFPQLKGKIPTGEPGKKASAREVNDAKTRKILGFKYISLEKSVVDTVQQVLDTKK